MLPGEWPGIPMITGAPGSGSTSPSAISTTSVRYVVRIAFLRSAYAKKPRLGPSRIAPDVGLRLVAAARPVGIGRVHVDRHAVVAAQSLGESDVVAVAVREDHAAHVVDRSPHRRQLVLQIAPVAGQPRVDHGDPLGRLDEIRGDDVVADAVEVGTELHGFSP